MKRKLSRTEEFEIMKLVLDKFLWIGVAVMVYGMYTMISGVKSLSDSLWIVAGGIVFFILFMIIIIREYEFLA